MRGRVAGVDASPSLLRISSLLRVSGSVAVPRSRRTSSWSAASSTTSQVAVSPINSGSVKAESAGPRRAAITTSSTRDVRSTASA
jgi:hypothetical protein